MIKNTVFYFNRLIFFKKKGMYFSILQRISWKQNSHGIYNGSIIDSIVVSVKTMKGFSSRKHQVNSHYFTILLIGIWKIEIFKLLDTHDNFDYWILAFICSIRNSSPIKK